MPANTVYVGHPSCWGNRFEVGKDGTAAACVRLFEVDHKLDVVDRAAGVRRDWTAGIWRAGARWMRLAMRIGCGGGPTPQPSPQRREELLRLPPVTGIYACSADGIL